MTTSAEHLIANKEALQIELGELDYPSYQDLLERILPDGHIVLGKFGDDDYQGKLLFVIGEGQFTSTYYTCTVWYGSCSYCDTLQAALESNDKGKDLWTLCLHMAQTINKVGA